MDTRRNVFTVLGTYKPTKYRGSVIGNGILNTIAHYGLAPLRNEQIKRNQRPIWSNELLHAEVRRSAVRGSEAESWHQDGDTTIPREEMDFGMVLWCQKDPTMLEPIEGGRILRPKPFEIIYFNNLDVRHKRPDSAASFKRRWSFRQRVEKWDGV